MMTLFALIFTGLFIVSNVLWFCITKWLLKRIARAMHAEQQKTYESVQKHRDAIYDMMQSKEFPGMLEYLVRKGYGSSTSPLFFLIAKAITQDIKDSKEKEVHDNGS